MKQIEINPSNKPYYSEDFIKGFECGTKTQFEADKEVIDRIKQARAEVEDRIDNYPDRNISEYEDCLAILDKLIAEAEG